MKSNYRYYNITLITLIVLALVSCNLKSDNHEDHKMKDNPAQTKQKYQCPMHPEVMSDKPDICPKCHMDLEPIAMSDREDSLRALVQPTNYVVISSLKPIHPSFNKGVSKINVSGFLTYNPDLAKSISARTSGRIEKLFVKYNFQMVEKGDLLLMLYSAELQTAQSEYLLLYKSPSPEKNILNGLYQKLINLGMSSASVEEIEKRGEVNATVPIYAPYSGHIHFLDAGSNISSHGLAWPKSSSGSLMETTTMEKDETKLTLKEGDYVKKGDLLFTIANESGLWALLKVLPSDINLIQKNDEVDVLVNGETHKGKIDFIEKSFDGRNDFFTARVYLTCNDHAGLKIGTLVKGVISVQSNKNKSLWVPSKSVINLGKSRSAVFVKQKVGYVAKEIHAGSSMGQWTEVLSGLTESDSIAPVASYLIDSEAFVNVK